MFTQCSDQREWLQQEQSGPQSPGTSQDTFVWSTILKCSHTRAEYHREHVIPCRASPLACLHKSRVPQGTCHPMQNFRPCRWLFLLAWSFPSSVQMFSLLSSPDSLSGTHPRIPPACCLPFDIFTICILKAAQGVMPPFFISHIWNCLLSDFRSNIPQPGPASLHLCRSCP